MNTTFNFNDQFLETEGVNTTENNSFVELDKLNLEEETEKLKKNTKLESIIEDNLEYFNHLAGFFFYIIEYFYIN